MAVLTPPPSVTRPLRVPRARNRWHRPLALLLAVIALAGLVREFSLLLEHFTWVGLRFALGRHPLAWSLLAVSVWLGFGASWRRSG